MSAVATRSARGFAGGGESVPATVEAVWPLWPASTAMGEWVVLGAVALDAFSAEVTAPTTDPEELLPAGVLEVGVRS